MGDCKPMLRAWSICTTRNSCSKVQHISWLGQINTSLCTLSLGCCNMSYHLYDPLKDDFPHDALFKCVISSPPRFLMTHASVLSVRCLTAGTVPRIPRVTSNYTWPTNNPILQFGRRAPKEKTGNCEARWCPTCGCHSNIVLDSVPCGSLWWVQKAIEHRPVT